MSSIIATSIDTDTSIVISIATVNSTNWTSALINSSNMQGIGPLIKKTWRESQIMCLWCRKLRKV